jgi:hypothetical protein
MRPQGALALAALLLVAGWSYAQDVQRTRAGGEAWVNPLVSPSEVKALEWVRANTAERTVFVTDIFGGEQLMGGALREGTIGGDWAIVPDVLRRFQDADEFVNTADAQKAWEIARRYGASYVWAPPRSVFAGYSWKDLERGKLQDERYFERVYRDGLMEIYRVK